MSHIVTAPCNDCKYTDCCVVCPVECFYQDETMLLVRITPAANVAGDALKLQAEANWLVCEDVCIPEEGKFELSLPIAGAATPAPAAIRGLFEKARQARFR